MLEDLPLDDQTTYELLARGDTLGVFQLDGGPMRALLRSMRPDKFEDISAVGALYRPGPMGMNSHNDYADRKNGRKPIDADPPGARPSRSREILGETYGLIVYQEQVMAIAQKVAGYSLGAGRPAAPRDGQEEEGDLDKEYVPFSAGMTERATPPAAIKALWDILVPFADYAFNKAHSAAYGLVSYWTAYLKANYPAEYMAALLTSVRDDKDKSALYLAECRRMGIKVLPPDVNASDGRLHPGRHRHPLRPGRDPQRRRQRGRLDRAPPAQRRAPSPTSPTSCARSTPVVCNKRTIESLIKAGAFDSLGHARRGLLHGPRAGRRRRRRHQAQRGHRPVRPVRLRRPRCRRPRRRRCSTCTSPTRSGTSRSCWPSSARCSGLYVSDHPAARGRAHPRRRRRHLDRHAACRAAPTGGSVTVAGILSSVSRRVTKAGAPWARATLEDLEGSIEVLFFPATYAQVGLQVVEDALVVLEGPPASARRHASS